MFKDDYSILVDILRKTKQLQESSPDMLETTTKDILIFSGKKFFKVLNQNVYTMQDLISYLKLPDIKA